MFRLERSLQSDRLRGEAGQTMSEYAIVLTVICVGIVATMGLLRAEIVSSINQVVGLL